MANIVKRVDLEATFSKMKIGDQIVINLRDATENNIRTAASRFNKKNRTFLKVIAPLGAGVTVIRQS